MGSGNPDNMDNSAIVVALRGLEREIGGLRKDMEKGDAAIMKEIADLSSQANGRTKKLEHALFGDEEASKIGALERLRNLEKGWAKLTTGAVLFVSLALEGLKWAGKAAVAKLSVGH